jgi:hypothetical protein
LDTNAEWPVFGSISIPHAVPRQCGDELQSLIWQVWAPSRAEFFMCLIVQNRVWTVDRLLQRQWPNECFCLLCIRNLETATHLLTDCEFSKLVWSQISEWASLPGFHPCRWREDCRMVRLQRQRGPNRGLCLSAGCYGANGTGGSSRELNGAQTRSLP